MLSKEQLDELEKLAKQAVDGPWKLETLGFEREGCISLSGQGHSAFAELVWEMEDGDSDEVQATANYISNVDPSTVIDLITMLREVEHSRDVLHDSCVRHLEEIEDLKRQGNELTANDLEKGKLYYIRGNGLCEYVGFDHYMGETTCQFRKIEYGQHPRDFFYTRIDKVSSTVFVRKEGEK